MKFKLTALVFAFVIFSMPLMAQKKKVAIVTFYADKYIDFTDLGGTAALAASIASLADDPNFDLKPVLDDFYKAFNEEIAPSLPFELVPESEVIGNEEYKNYESLTGETSDEDKSIFQKRYLPVEGYKPMREYLGKKYRNELRMLEIFGDKVDGVMFVYLDFAFAKKIAVGGTGSAGMRSYIRMKLWNKEGKKVFALDEYGTSKKSIGMVGGVPVTTPQKVLPLCESATERLIKDVMRKLPSKFKKIDKKL